MKRKTAIILSIILLSTALALPADYLYSLWIAPYAGWLWGEGEMHFANGYIFAFIFLSAIFFYLTVNNENKANWAIYFTPIFIIMLIIGALQTLAFMIIVVIAAWPIALFLRMIYRKMI